MVTYFENRTDVKNPSWKTLDDIVKLIKEDQEIAQKISLVRMAHYVYNKEQDPERKDEKKREKDKIKGELPGFVISGEFNTRNNDSCLKYYGRIVIDIDHIDNPAKLKQKVKTDKTVVMAFISPSGDGLKIIHLLEFPDLERDELIEFHRQAFLSLAKLYDKKYNISIDQNCKDISRLCFISSDHSIYFNSEAEGYSFNYFKKITVIDSRDNIPLPELYYKSYGIHIGTQEDAIEVLEDICKWQDENNICIVKNYSNWLRVMFALKNIVGDNQIGEELFQKLSHNYDKYNSKEVSKKWNDKSNLLDESKKIPSMGSILWLAGIYGYKCKLKGKVNKNTSYNVLTSKLIERHIYLRLNTLSRRLQIKKDNIWINMTERNLINIALDVFEGKKVKETKEFLTDCSPEVNPAKEFLDNLPIWDKVDRLIQLSDTLKSKNIDENLKLIYLRKWFIGVVNGLLNSPAHGQYNENVIILIGEQAIGKTRWSKSLLPQEYNEYFAVKNIDPQLKDDQILLSEKFIILLDESAHLLKTSSADLKSLTSTEKFSVRAPYGYLNDDYCRVASLIGSSNDYQLLNDPTGNRRFWVIELEKADYNHKIDMYQLWAQAKYLYDMGEPHWLEKDELKLQAKSVERFEKNNSYDDLIKMFLGKGASNDEFMSATEILSYFSECLGNKMPQQLYVSALGSYLKKCGFERKHRDNRWGYYVYRKETVIEGQSGNITASIVNPHGKSQDLFVN